MAKIYGDNEWGVDCIPTWCLWDPNEEHPVLLAFSEKHIRTAGLGLLGGNFVSLLEESVDKISCPPSCFSDSTQCTCGAEDLKARIAALVEQSKFWTQSGESWDALKERHKKYKDAEKPGTFRVIPVDPTHWNDESLGLPMEDDPQLDPIP